MIQLVNFNVIDFIKEVHNMKIAEFKTGKTPFLLATDVAARGLGE